MANVGMLATQATQKKDQRNAVCFPPPHSGSAHETPPVGLRFLVSSLRCFLLLFCCEIIPSTCALVPAGTRASRIYIPDLMISKRTRNQAFRSKLARKRRHFDFLIFLRKKKGKERERMGPGRLDGYLVTKWGDRRDVFLYFFSDGQPALAFVLHVFGLKLNNEGHVQFSIIWGFLAKETFLLCILLVFFAMPE
jgi:hypothetical protein